MANHGWGESGIQIRQSGWYTLPRLVELAVVLAAIVFTDVLTDDPLSCWFSEEIGPPAGGNPDSPIAGPTPIGSKATGNTTGDVAGAQAERERFLVRRGEQRGREEQNQTQKEWGQPVAGRQKTG